MDPSHKLAITHTWDGQAAPPHEHCALTVRDTPQGLKLTIDAPWHGDPAPEGPARSLWGLWEYEVVELFLVGPDERYLEVEIGPHGHFLAFPLQGKRQQAGPTLALAPQVTRHNDRWTAQALIPYADCPPGPWTWNAFAIHGQGDQRRYLAAFAVPGPAPDFHRLECFPPSPLSGYARRC